MEYPNIFIPSYKRARNNKTANYFVGGGYPADKIHVFIDSEATDKADYEDEAAKLGFNLHVFSQEESRERYDYVHRPSTARRSAGQARNQFYDIAKQLGITEYIVIDDDTQHFEYRPFGKYGKLMSCAEVAKVFANVMELVKKHRIGIFGLSQTGEMFDNKATRLLRFKVMNVTFINTRFMYRGERGVQDNDTSQFVGLLNEGYFCASYRTGCVLHQTASATAEGGLTDLYRECRLLNKSLVCVIQFPSAIRAEKQVRNGGRLHHKINYRYLMPKILRGNGTGGNIAYDTYAEDVPFTNEPKRINNKSVNYGLGSTQPLSGCCK